MKKLQILLTLLIFIILVSCDNNSNSATRSAEKIEFFIDGSPTPLQYSTNIVAKDYPLNQTSGWSCGFEIKSEDASANVFLMPIGLQVSPCSFFYGNTPASFVVTGSNISIINIQGIDIDYNNPGNSLTFNYNAFGDNFGDDIKIVFLGNYYDNSGINHTITGNIDIKRD